MHFGEKNFLRNFQKNPKNVNLTFHRGGVLRTPPTQKWATRPRPSGYFGGNQLPMTDYYHKYNQ